MTALHAGLRTDAWRATAAVDRDVPSHIRATTPADGPSLGAFLGEAFKGDAAHPAFDARQFHWKYWQPRSDRPGPRSFVMMRGETIVAHAGVVPGRLNWQGGSLDTLHVIEWAARPGAVGAGTALMKHVGTMCDALLAIGGNARTLALLPVLRFQRVGEATSFVRSLRPMKLLPHGAPWGLRDVMKTARGLVWRVGTHLRHEGMWQVRRVAPGGLDKACLPLLSERPGAVTGERTAAMLDYMLSCPATPMALYRINKVGTSIRGYFLLALAPRQARLADCRLESDDPQDWQSLIQLAVSTALENPGVAEIVALSSDPLLSQGLAQCGFHARQAQPIQWLVKPGLETPSGPVHVQLLDNDEAWLHGGR